MTCDEQNLNTVLDKLEKFADHLILRLQDSCKKTSWQKITQGAKDFVPVITSLAAVIVTVAIGYSTYVFNDRQAALSQADLKRSQADLKRSWLADFTESEVSKRKLGSLKLAAYGVDALPAIKEALSIPDQHINEGGVLAARMIYENQPENRAPLLTSMTTYFGENNATLRRNVMEFYFEVNQELDPSELKAFYQLLTKRLGAKSSNCKNEDAAFALIATQFVARTSFDESSQWLLDIATNCPRDKNYDSSRTQAVKDLQIRLQQKPPSKMIRDEMINSLQALAGSGSEEFNHAVDSAIAAIKQMQVP